MPYAPPDVPSQYLNYGKKGSSLRPKPDFFFDGLAKAKDILNSPPKSDKKSAKSQSAQNHGDRPKPIATVTYTYQKPRIPHLPEYESYRTARMEILMERGAVERQRRVQATMKSCQSFASDKEFLQMLCHKSNKTTTDRQIREMSKSVLAFIDTRNIYWKQQIPEHVQKSQKVVAHRKPSLHSLQASPKSGRTKKQQQQQQQHQQQKQQQQQSRLQKFIDKVVNELTRITQIMNHGHYDRAITAAKKLVDDISSVPQSFPGKESILSNCSCILGNAYLELNDEKKAIAYHMNDLMLATEYNLEDSKSRAMDNLARVYARTGQFEKAIGLWEQKLELYPNLPQTESVWIYHELGYCYLKLTHHIRASECGEKSLEAAKKMHDNQWQLNASMLIAQAVMASGDAFGCKQAFERALKAAVKAGDKEAEETVKETLQEIAAVLDDFREKESASRSTNKSPTDLNLNHSRDRSRLSLNHPPRSLSVTSLNRTQSKRKNEASKSSSDLKYNSTVTSDSPVKLISQSDGWTKINKV